MAVLYTPRPSYIYIYVTTGACCWWSYACSADRNVVRDDSKMLTVRAGGLAGAPPPPYLEFWCRWYAYTPPFAQCKRRPASRSVSPIDDQLAQLYIYTY